MFIRNKVGGWSHRELASEIGITMSALKSRMFEARSRMREHLRAVGCALGRGRFPGPQWAAGIYRTRPSTEKIDLEKSKKVRVRTFVCWPACPLVPHGE